MQGKKMETIFGTCVQQWPGGEDDVCRLCGGERVSDSSDSPSPLSDGSCHFHFSILFFLSGCDIRLCHTEIIMKHGTSYKALSLLPRATNRFLTMFITECGSIFLCLKIALYCHLIEDEEYKSSWQRKGNWNMQ